MRQEITFVEITAVADSLHRYEPFAVVRVCRGPSNQHRYGLDGDLTRASLLRCQRAQLALMERGR